MWRRERCRSNYNTELVLTSSLLRENVVAIKINILIVWARPTMKILDWQLFKAHKWVPAWRCSNSGQSVSWKWKYFNFWLNSESSVDKKWQFPQFITVARPHTLSSHWSVLLVITGPSVGPQLLVYRLLESEEGETEEKMSRHLMLVHSIEYSTTVSSLQGSGEHQSIPVSLAAALI